jgi:single-strand DNA-binding protein
MLNKIQLIGNLGDNPEVRTTKSGKAVASFYLATNRRWKDREGKKHEETDWHNVVCWGPRAKIAADYLARGRQVYVEGRLQTTSWEDEEAGVTRYRTEIVCRNLLLLGGKSDLALGEAPHEEPPGEEAGQEASA